MLHGEIREIKNELNFVRLDLWRLKGEGAGVEVKFSEQLSVFFFFFFVLNGICLNAGSKGGRTLRI